MTYIFGNYELDLQHHELRRAGVPVKLERQAWRVLTYLIQHRGRMVPKQELIEHLWSQPFVSDGALARCLGLIRRVLGDSGREQRIIKTAYGSGYCFMLAVEERGSEVITGQAQPRSSNPSGSEEPAADQTNASPWALHPLPRSSSRGTTLSLPALRAACGSPHC